MLDLLAERGEVPGVDDRDDAGQVRQTVRAVQPLPDRTRDDRVGATEPEHGQRRLAGEVPVHVLVEGVGELASSRVLVCGPAADKLGVVGREVVRAPVGPDGVGELARLAAETVGELVRPVVLVTGLHTNRVTSTYDKLTKQWLRWVVRVVRPSAR